MIHLTCMYRTHQFKVPVSRCERKRYVWWRRRESNPRPKLPVTKRGSMLSRVPETLLLTLRTDKVSQALVR